MYECLPENSAIQQLAQTHWLSPSSGSASLEVWLIRFLKAPSKDAPTSAFLVLISLRHISWLLPLANLTNSVVIFEY